MRRNRIEVLRKWEKEAKSEQVKANLPQPHKPYLGKPKSKQIEMRLMQVGLH